MAILLCMFVVHLVLLGWVILNVRQWPSLLPTEDTPLSAQPQPLVSILLPARNEAQMVGRCIASLRKQTYASWELLVLDDESHDETAHIVQMHAQLDPRITLLTGKPLPDGWIGKCHACAQLATHAKGEWLLFTDADTIHDTDMLSRTLVTAQTYDAGLLTGFPRVVSTHAFGWLVLSLMHFVIALHLPVSFVRTAVHPHFIAAHGAFMLYRKTVYDHIGGHAAPLHRHALVEDMVMAKAVKRNGFAVSLVDICPVVACEMYRTPQGVWDGFAKNIFNGMGRSTPLFLGILLLYTLLYIVPVCGIAYAVWLGSPYTLWGWIGCVLVGICTKATVDHRFGVRIRWSACLPYSMVLLVVLGLRSWYRALRKSGYWWKERKYES